MFDGVCFETLEFDRGPLGSILVHWGPLGVCWSQILGSNPLRVHWSQLLVGAWWLCGGGSLEVCYLFVRFLLGLLCGLALLSKNCIFCILIKVKFGFSEKHTKFEKIFLMALTN